MRPVNSHDRRKNGIIFDIMSRGGGWSKPTSVHQRSPLPSYRTFASQSAFTASTRNNDHTRSFLSYYYFLDRFMDRESNSKLYINRSNKHCNSVTSIARFFSSFLTFRLVNVIISNIIISFDFGKSDLSLPQWRETRRGGKRKKKIVKADERKILGKKKKLEARFKKLNR